MHHCVSPLFEILVDYSLVFLLVFVVDYSCMYEFLTYLVQIVCMDGDDNAHDEEIGRI
jgi:hypothetical protein